MTLRQPATARCRRQGAIALSLLLSLAACGPKDGPPGGSPGGSPDAQPPGRGPATAAHDAGAGSRAEVRFTDVTAASGIAWRHNTGAFGKKWLPETLGPGVVVLDADGDRRLDLLFVNGRNFAGQPGEATPPALYLNRGGLRFTLAGRDAGLSFSAYCLGGSAADVDNDGDGDLFLSCLGRDLLLRNDGGRFVDLTDAAGLTRDHELGAGAAFFDADNDGHLDLYVTRYVTWTPGGDVFCSLDGKTKSYCTPVLYQGASPRFYRGRGDGTFEERTRAAGFFDPQAKTLAAVPLDLDQDGWIDLAVAGDTYPNLLYRNRGDGTFEEIGAASGIAYSDTGTARGGMGVDAADYNRSGRPSVVISYFANEMVGLYENQGNQMFTDVAPSSDVGRNTLLTLGWATLFFDYDLDGWLDLLVANGHLDEQVENVQALVEYDEPQQLFHNQGAGRFVEVTSTAGGDLANPLVARGGAFADFDDDGDLDVVLTTNGGPAKLFENRGTGYGHWLRLSLRGTESNRDGLGARIEVRAGGGTQSWLVRTGGSYLSQSQIDPVFGLGTAPQADEVKVHWPSGKLTTLTQVPGDQRVEVREE